jgi:multiple sugar transport system ATP-binding protein
MRSPGATLRLLHAASGTRLDLSDYPFNETPDEGHKVVVGLRPEHFIVGDKRQNGVGASFSLPVRYTEKTGSDVTMFLDNGDGDLIAVRFDHKHHHVPEAGEAPDIWFPRNRFDVFDAASERRI